MFGAVQRGLRQGDRGHSCLLGVESDMTVEVSMPHPPTVLFAAASSCPCESSSMLLSQQFVATPFAQKIKYALVDMPKLGLLY